MKQLIFLFAKGFLKFCDCLNRRKNVIIQVGFEYQNMSGNLIFIESDAEKLSERLFFAARACR